MSHPRFSNHEVDIFNLMAVSEERMSGWRDNQSPDLGELDTLERVPERFLKEVIRIPPSDLQRVEVWEGL